DPKPGDRFQHIESGTVAVFVEWRRQPDAIGGRRVMVLGHPTFGECRWHPSRVRPYVPPATPTPAPSLRSAQARAHRPTTRRSHRP
ncbi:hypothetical protein, partial [Prauserella endophytica]|uniref:hypothetical protein n=1 Tax=Prauserella endophytica TaxID=1592324 RepID=UPI00197D2B49